MQRSPSRADVMGADLVWCLDLTWGGCTHRLATHRVDLTLPDGSEVSYADALSDPDVLDEVSREGIQESSSVPLAVFLDGIDVAERVARGYRLEQARGHLFSIFLDQRTEQSRQTYAERFQYLTGQLSRPVYADPTRHEGFLSFTLEDSPGDDNALLLDERAVINDTTWSGADDAANGKPYPLIIGSPGRYRKPTGLEVTTSGSPGYVVARTGSDADTLLIAGHEVSATTVRVFDEDGDYETLNVSTALDSLGRLVAVADLSAAVTINRTHTTFWVGWISGGGMPSPFSSGALSGLGSVCAWALLRSSRPVDVEAWIAESGLLDRFEVDTYINEPILSPWSFVTRLLESVSVEVRSGPDGLYPHARQMDAPDAEGLALLIEGPDLEAVGPVVTRTQLSEVINKCTVRFAPRAITGDYKRSLTIQADPEASDPEVFPDEYAELSVNRWSTDPDSPVVQAEVLDLDWVYDETTAGLIAQERIQVRGFGYAERSYSAHRRYGWLAPGVQVRLESATLYRTVLATVLSRRWGGTGWDLVFALDEDPIRMSAGKYTGG